MARRALGRLALLAVLAGTGLAGTGGPAGAEVDIGAYLAARSAGATGDLEAAARYYGEALAADPTNAGLIENTIRSLIGIGDFENAVPLAQTLGDMGVPSVFARLVTQAELAREGDWDGILSALEAGETISPLMDGLLRAWAYVGKGDMTKALSAFDEMIEQPGLRPFGMYHKALALAVVGDLEGADAILAGPDRADLQRTRRATIAHALILARLDRPEDAVARIDSTFGGEPDPMIDALRTAVAAGERFPYGEVTDARTGVAELYFSVASAIAAETPDGLTLLYARLAQALDPTHSDAVLLSGAVLDEMQQHTLAAETLATIGPENPSFHAAELGRADALRNGDQPERAAEVLENLTRVYPESAVAFASLGDMQRRLELFEPAKAAYGRALELYPEDHPGRWFVYFVRGIVNYELDDWPGAEADFRASLALSPDQPQVLNYLGYSLVERRENLDEALDMIERAVAGQPQNGAIVDSLGWALYRLGRYEDAVAPMERAAELEPVDPVVNDHLGDVYWAVGRQMEARFQWHRALSFDPEPEEAERIRRKLEVGLDVVLQEEGADPLTVAQDG
jgi:tetratricopeptide (TPR) repeat protein